MEERSTGRLGSYVGTADGSATSNMLADLSAPWLLTCGCSATINPGLVGQLETFQKRLVPLTKVRRVDRGEKTGYNPH